MATSNSELRFSQLVSGSTSDLACVVSMLDDLLERSRRADLFPDLDSTYSPPALATSSSADRSNEDCDGEDLHDQTSSSAPILSSSGDQQPLEDRQRKVIASGGKWATSRATKSSTVGLNRPLSIESANSTSSGTSSESSHSRLHAWPSVVDVCPGQLATTSSCRSGREHSLKASSSSLSTEEALSSAGSAGATLQSDVSGCAVEYPYLQRVLSELVVTEKDYVESLHQIIDGYMNYWKENPPKVFSEESCAALFGNITDIFNCNSDFQAVLDGCDGDPLCVAESFVQHGDRFAVYVQYCTSYPRAVSVLTELMASEVTAAPFRARQQALGHALPLGSHLLKPVQRILKYHLLLQNIRRGLEMNGGDTTTVSAALVTMTTLADHINSMKRRHEYAVRVQEIQSLLYGWQGADLTTLGELVAEGTFRMYRAKTSRHMFLFDRLLLITKRREDSALSYKTHILCSNLMLVESISGEPLCFHVIPFDNPRVQYTLQARNKEQKRAWTLQLKRVILESYNVVIPYHTRELVLKLGQEDDETDGECWHRQRSSRRYPVAADYLERRHGVKVGHSFSRRLGLCARARSTDTAGCSGGVGGEGRKVPQPVREQSDSRHESCTRGNSAPSSPISLSRTVLRSQSSTGPLTNHSTPTPSVSTPVPPQPSESLQSIVEQLVLQNVHVRRAGSHRAGKRSARLQMIETGKCNGHAGSGVLAQQTLRLQNSTPLELDSSVGDGRVDANENVGHGSERESALTVEHFENSEYISFSDYSAVNSPLTRPHMFPTLQQAAAAMSGVADSRVSLHRTVSDPCRRVGRAAGRQWPRHGDMTQLLTALRRRTSLRRAAAAHTYARTCGNSAGGVPSCSSASAASIKLPAYLTPQLGKRADRLAAQLVRRSGSLGRDTAGCVTEAVECGASSAINSCGSSLAGSCDSLAANQLPVCRFYGAHHGVSAGSLRQMVGSMRSRLTQRLRQRVSVEGETDVYHHHQHHQQQSGSRLMSVLARALKERSSESKSDGSGDLITDCALVNGSPLIHHHHHLVRHQQRPSSTLSESTSYSSTSSGVATEGSRARGSDGEASSQDSCEHQQLPPQHGDGRHRDSAVYSEPESDSFINDCNIAAVSDTPADTSCHQHQQPGPTRTPSIRDRLRSLHQSLRGANNTPVSDKNLEAQSASSNPLTDAESKSLRGGGRRCGTGAKSGRDQGAVPVQERRQRMPERWRARGAGGDDESETSSQHSTSTQNTVVEGAAATTGWVRQVIGKLQGDLAAV